MKNQFAKTKILVTIGPASDTKEKLEALIDAGADGFRLNFSHGNYEYFEHVFHLINEICVEKSLPIPILIDLQGPKIRIGELSQPEIKVKSGDLLEITTQNIIGTKEKISTSYVQLIEDAQIGETILIDDGLIKLVVEEKNKDSLMCRIIEGGILKPKKGMNLPGMKLSTPSVTEKDFKDLEFALKHRVDFIALSFVRKQEDIINLRTWLEEKGIKIPLIAKIEKEEAVKDFEKILEVSDGIMIARGDLGVEIGVQQVPVIQKKIIRRCNEVGKLVITATQMLESMIKNPVPTRAEVSDIANAVWDGTDVVMLSGETSVGNFPVEAVKVMNQILLTTEAEAGHRRDVNYHIPDNIFENMIDASGAAVVKAAEQMNASAIVIFTHLGIKASIVSKFRPDASLFAISDKFETLNTLNLHWGIKPFFLDKIYDEEIAITNSTKLLKEKKLIKDGDVIIFTAGQPMADKGRRTWMRFIVV
ncbi:MAG: pyruvate kinase [Melioribacter sp.]|uniref:pyruvate kinase n=1 Tax=Rosettibacter primus TaxID=3111523 RepID=UPI00247B8D19|nr:pyruvate kinase [Melioribacter sp.]